MEQPHDKAEISIALSKDYAYYINPTPRKDVSLLQKQFQSINRKEGVI